METSFLQIDPKLYIFFSSLAILLSGVSGVLIAHFLMRSSARVNSKRDVLSRFVGNRFALTEPSQHLGTNGEPFVSLNEICVVYAKDKDVIQAVKKMHGDIADPSRLNDNLMTLIKRMARAARVPIDESLHDSFFVRPFTPTSGGIKLSELITALTMEK